MLPKITIHTLVKNEDRWIWYALNSVLNVADKILVFDTGSTDSTVSIIKSFASPKIIFESHPAASRADIVRLRQLQLRRTRTPWFMLVDGDEIWPQANLHQLVSAAAATSSHTLAFFTRTRNCVGDIYHYLPESAGRYSIKGITGHLNIHLIRNVPGLGIAGEYPLEAYTLNGIPIQTLDNRLQFVDTWYLHTTHLPRSTSKAGEKSVIDRLSKRKFRFGLSMARTELPQVFWLPRPSLVPAPITNRWKSLFL